METIYSNPFWTSFFIFQMGFWLTVAISHLKLFKE